MSSWITNPEFRINVQLTNWLHCTILIIMEKLKKTENYDTISYSWVVAGLVVVVGAAVVEHRGVSSQFH